jgi:hypothetical protein
MIVLIVFEVLFSLVEFLSRVVRLQKGGLGVGKRISRVALPSFISCVLAAR